MVIQGDAIDAGMHYHSAVPLHADDRMDKAHFRSPQCCMYLSIALLAMHHCPDGFPFRAKHVPVLQLVPARPEPRSHLRLESPIGPPLAAEPLLCRHKDVQVAHWEVCWRVCCLQAVDLGGELQTTASASQSSTEMDDVKSVCMRVWMLDRQMFDTAQPRVGQPAARQAHLALGSAGCMGPVHDESMRVYHIPDKQNSRGCLGSIVTAAVNSKQHLPWCSQMWDDGARLVQQLLIAEEHAAACR
jgi:hypothetical protein